MISPIHRRAGFDLGGIDFRLLKDDDRAKQELTF
jgi:hypothetical protein